MKKVNRARAADAPAAHLQHEGIWIDASWKAGKIEFYVVFGSSGRFYSLDAAKEIAEAIAERKAA